MPGGKRRLKNLFTGGGIQVGADGTRLTEILAGSVGFATAGCANTTVHTACLIAEVSITGLNENSFMIATAEDMSACYRYDGILPGDGQASIVYRYCGCGASVDARAGTNGGTLRYIAFS